MKAHDASVTDHAPSGLGDVIRLTQTSYRDAVSETVRGLQAELSDNDMADVWGVSASTVGNARNRNSDLAAISLLKIGKIFGPHALNTVLRLIGAKAVSIEAVHIDVAAVPCEVAQAVPTLIRLLADGDASDADIRQLDREGIINRFSEITDMLEQRRDALRLKVASTG